MGYKDLLSEKNYIRNFMANMINRFGDSIDALAFSWMVYQITGSASWSAVIFGLNSVPTIFLMPFAGVIVEKHKKKNIMMICDIARAVLVLITTFLYVMNFVTPVMLAIFTLLMSTFEAFRIPAGLALYPKILPREKFTVGAALNQATSNFFVILGASAFGVITLRFGVEGAMIVNAITFVLSAFFVSRIDVKEKMRTDLKLDIKGFFKEFKEGFLYLKSKEVVFLICISGSIIGVLFIPLNSLMTPYVQGTLKLGEIAISLISVAMTVGSIIGTFLFPKINTKFKKSTLFIFGGIVISLSYLLFNFASYITKVNTIYISLGIIAFMVGISGSLISLGVNIAFMEHVEDNYLGRVGSIFNSMVSALVPVASFLIALISKTLSVGSIFVLFGTLSLITFTILNFNKSLKKL